MRVACFIVTYCKARRLGVATSAHVRIWPSGFAATTPVIPKRRNMVCHGSSFIAKPFLLARKRHNANDTTRVAVVEMNLISYDRAVAAATGRRFKSSRPDVASRIGK